MASNSKSINIIPRARGGTATIDNGETMCAKHNFIKKNFDQTEFGKRYFIGLYKSAKKKQGEANAKVFYANSNTV